MKPMLFGKYCLLERISVGGMAEVFRAKPFNAPGFEGYLALKRILPHLAEDDEFIQMFIDEAKLTVLLDHPNIVRIYELGQFQASYYILMEFISGRDLLTLQKRVRKRRETIHPALSCYIAREIALGLDFAHRRADPDGMPLNIIHRDVSPQNVLIDFLGKVKVIDFGIAKAAVQSTRTQVGVLKGKMGYMSPEQVQGEQLDYRSDIFSIGTVFWEMLTNRRLFNGENEFETMQLVKHAVAEPPSTKNPEIPPEIDRIAMRALAGNREERYQSGAELAHDLTNYLNHVGVGAQEMSMWMREVFAEELQEEIDKRDEFAQIQTPDDVRALLTQTDQPEPVVGQSTTESEEQYEKTAIWDAEILEIMPADDVDPMDFAAQHTVVQAGGFDPTLYEKEDLSPPLSAAPMAAPPVQLGTDMAFQTEGTRPDIKPARSSPGPLRYVAMGLAIVMFMVICGVATYFVVHKKPTPTGGMLLSVNPAAEIEILIDGKIIGASSPMRIENLPVGPHVLEVRHATYNSYQQKVDVNDSIQSFEIDLIPKGPPTGTVRIASPELTGLRIWVDGEERGDDVLGRAISLPVGEHLFEMHAPEHRSWRQFVEVKRGDEIDVRPLLERQGFQLEVAGEPRSVVRFDGKRIGAVPATVTNIDPREIHQIEVSIRAEMGVSRWKSYVAMPEIAMGKLQASFDSPPFRYRKSKFGWLTVDTGSDWWSVWVDGQDTGLITPLAAPGIPLYAGEHTVSLRRGYDKKEFPVTLKAGDTAQIEENLKFKWE